MLHIVLTCCMVVLQAGGAAPDLASDVIEPQLRLQLDEVEPGAQVEAYLVMEDQLTLDHFWVPVQGMSRQQRRDHVRTSLKQHCEQSQVEVQAVLARAARAGRAEIQHVLWIGNAVVFQAEPGVIRELATLDGVDRIRRSRRLGPEELEDMVPAAPAALAAWQTSIAQHVTQLEGDQLWDIGIDGSGVIIANIDTGVDRTHPDLAGRIWINQGEIPDNLKDDDLNGFVDDVVGWDYWDGDNDPSPPALSIHGTAAAGLMVGDGTSGTCTGMAPGSSMMVLRMNSEATTWAAQQYALDNGADVVSASISFKWPSRPDYHMHRQVCDMELAAGLIHAHSIGNEGDQTGTHPVPFNISAPGLCPSPWGHPDAVKGPRSSVIACAGIHLADDSLYLPSGQGPCAWDDLLQYDAAYPHSQDPALWTYPYGGFAGSQPGLLKPDVVTYTNTVQSTNAGGGYVAFSGTSATTPQVGGGLALLRQAQPEALPRHLAAALEITAVDLGPTGKDTRYGSGKIQLFDAARRLVLLGRVSDPEPSPGDTVVMSVYGEPNGIFGIWVGGALRATGWNLKGPSPLLGLFVLDASGEATINMPIPTTNPALVGLDIYFLLMGTIQDKVTWGNGNLLSVPELVSIQS